MNMVSHQAVGIDFEVQFRSCFPQQKLDRYLSTASLESRFLAFAKAKDGLEPADSAEWEDTKSYMMPQVNALVGRYSKLGENAFYHLYLPIDNTVTIALGE